MSCMPSGTCTQTFHSRVLVPHSIYFQKLRESDWEVEEGHRLSVWAAVTEHHNVGDWQTTEIYFPQFLRQGSLGHWCQKIWCLVRPRFIDVDFMLCPRMMKKQSFPRSLSFFNLNVFIFHWRQITLQYCTGFPIHQYSRSAPRVYMFPTLNPPSHLPPRPPSL